MTESTCVILTASLTYSDTLRLATVFARRSWEHFTEIISSLENPPYAKSTVTVQEMFRNANDCHSVTEDPNHCQRVKLIL